MTRPTIPQGRPPTLVSVERMDWGVWIEHRGTREQLLAAGALTAEDFAAVGKSGQRAWPTEFGDGQTLYRATAKGVHRLMLKLTIEGNQYGDVGEPREAWRKLGAAVTEVVAVAIGKMQRT